ncbi:hypothetical protein [Egicoccus sp. AB-alg6-2]|uniref:hypothetical protein n=1 Tax=Egicoccus sp. AB-alg6-2 TaxID=3242692 RepID=UPI00359D67EA
MGRTVRIVGGASIVLAPLLFGIGDQVRMVADPPTEAGIVGEYGIEEATASLAMINANRATFVVASYLFYVAMLLTIPALLAIWRISVARAPRWAWTGAVLAMLFALGQVVHLVGHFAMSQVFAAHDDLTTAAELTLAAESNAFIMALFVPLYLVGLLATIPQAVGLRRARVIPLWATLCLVAGTVLFVVAGSTPATSAIWTVLLVTGLAPAASAMLRGAVDPAAPRTQPVAATA